MADLSYLDRNVETVRKEIAETTVSCGRTDPPCLLAAVKYTGVDEINYMHTRLGIHDIGENRVQQLLERWDKLEDRDHLNVHFIGTLQKNKVKYIIDKVCLIHSVDNLDLAAEIDKRARQHGKIMDVLVEINSGSEESKSGVLPENAEALCRDLTRFPNISLRGFMTMAPKCEKSEDYLRFFGETSRLCLDIWYKKLDNIIAPVLSMGMSDSYREAIRCGATVVRIGRQLFRNPEADMNQ